MHRAQLSYLTHAHTHSHACTRACTCPRAQAPVRSAPWPCACLVHSGSQRHTQTLSPPHTCAPTPVCALQHPRNQPLGRARVGRVPSATHILAVSHAHLPARSSTPATSPLAACVSASFKPATDVGTPCLASERPPATSDATSSNEAAYDSSHSPRSASPAQQRSGGQGGSVSPLGYGLIKCD